MSVNDLLEDYGPVIHAVAAEGGRQFWKYGADREDFSQELMVWVLDNNDWLTERRAEMDDDDQFSKFLARCLRNEVLDYGLDIRAHAGGQDRQTAFWYTKNELAALLPSMFDPEAWLNPPASDGKSVSDPALGNNWVATLSDVSLAFSRLDLGDQTLLRAFHEEGVRNKDLAEMYDVTEATMSYRHTQALKRLLGNLGGEKPRHMRPDNKYDPWRGRRAVSNAAARALTDNQYEED